MFTLRLQVVYLVWTLVVFGAVAFFSRADWRRVTGAVCSVLVFTAISVPIDSFAASVGWWIYPSCVDPPHPPMTIYLGQAIMFVGSIALVAWRIRRASGIVWLFAIVCTLGLVRDLAVGAVLRDVIRFGPMPASAIADMAAWATVVLVALTVSSLAWRVLGGRAQREERDPGRPAGP